MAQLTTVQRSRSFNSSFATRCWNSKKKSCFMFEHSCSRPLTRAHTFRVSGYSHRMWLVISGSWPHMSHLCLFFTLLLFKLSLVGKILDHARQMKVRTLGGMLRVHIFFQIGPSVLAEECSTQTCCCRRRATWYAVLTEKCLFVFSINTR